MNWSVRFFVCVWHCSVLFVFHFYFCIACSLCVCVSSKPVHIQHCQHDTNKTNRMRDNNKNEKMKKEELAVDTNFMYSSSLASSIRLCGQTVRLGKLVFQTNLFRSIDITTGDVWNLVQVRWVNDAVPKIAMQIHVIHSNLWDVSEKV